MILKRISLRLPYGRFHFEFVVENCLCSDMFRPTSSRPKRASPGYEVGSIIMPDYPRSCDQLFAVGPSQKETVASLAGPFTGKLCIN